MLTAGQAALEELEVTIEASWDAQGLFELASVGAGLSNVAVVVGVRSNASDGDLDRIGEITTRTSAICNSLAHPVPIELSVRRIHEPGDGMALGAQSSGGNA